MAFADSNNADRFDSDGMQKVNLFETKEMFCDVYCLEPGQQQAVHAHAGATKFYFVLEGEATITIGTETRRIGPGELGWSVAAEPHGVRNDSMVRLRLLVAMAPNPNAAKV